jgi:hypothetical protein
VDIRWMMTAIRVFRHPLKDHTIAPITRWLFRRIAAYGFTTMPPMPPRLCDEVADRPLGACEALAYARQTLNGDRPGLEGVDLVPADLTPSLAWGVLCPPGRMRVICSRRRLRSACAQCPFWTRLPPSIPSGLSRASDTRQPYRDGIAGLLPIELWGEFRGSRSEPYPAWRATDDLSPFQIPGSSTRWSVSFAIDKSSPSGTTDPVCSSRCLF